jgi:excisionase family DNA binding protein
MIEIAQTGTKEKLDFALVTASEVARRTGLSRWTVYHWARIGILPSVKLSRRRLFDQRDIESFIDEHKRRGKITQPRGAFASQDKGEPAV